MNLKETREKITKTDQEIINLLKKRMEFIDQIVEIKKKNNQSITDKEREKKVIEQITDYAAENGIDPSYTKQIFEKIIEMSKEKQRNKMGEGNLP